MASPGDVWRAFLSLLRRPFAANDDAWVEPGNRITRVVLSGIELSLPNLERWTEPRDEPVSLDPPPATVPVAAAGDEPSRGPGTTRAA